MSKERGKDPKSVGSEWGTGPALPPATPDNSLVNRTGPGGGRLSGAPPSPRIGGCLAEPNRFEEPEASVTLGA